MKDHHPDQLIEIFNNLFLDQYQTRLDYSQDEPVYLPADANCPDHRVLFAHGFFASALHEISHWCIAGEARRKLVDFGYWYQPDGRTGEQQREFEHVEIKPQAIEWVLSKACGSKFNISTDNLNGDPEDILIGREKFAKNVHQQVKKYLENGLPLRAAVLKQALLDYYQKHKKLTVDDFALSELITPL
mgnify:CR=1 FL=1